MNFRQCFWRYRRVIFAVLLSTGLSVACISIVPYMTKIVLDSYARLSIKQAVIYSCVYVMAIAMFLLAEYAKKISFNKLQQVYGLDVRTHLFKKILCLPHAVFNQQQAGHYINALTNDLENIYINYILCYVQLAVSLISLAIYLSYMIYLNLLLALALILACLLALLLPQLLGDRLSVRRREFSQAEAYFIDALNDLLAAHEVYDVNSCPKFSQIFANYNFAFEKEQRSLVDCMALSNIFSASTLYLINIVTFALGLFLVASTQLALSSLIAMLAFVDLVAIPTRDIIYQIINIRSSKHLISKLDKFFVDEPKKSLEAVDFKQLEVRNLDYQIGSFQLPHISLTIEKGKKYLLLGDNASGKSTLLKLLAGELPRPKKMFFLDGLDLAQVDTSQLIYYGANSKAFKASVLENVAISSDKAVSEMAKDVVKAFSDKQVDFNGRNLSQGQQARVALARALNSPKEILLLDEIFANVDAASEQELTHLLLQTDRTLVLISHNRSDVYKELFDKVYCL